MITVHLSEKAYWSAVHSQKYMIHKRADNITGRLLYDFMINQTINGGKVESWMNR